MVRAHKMGFTVKKGKKATTTGTIILSAVGKSRTVTSSGTDAQGNKHKSTAVYDKQRTVLANPQDLHY